MADTATVEQGNTTEGVNTQETRTFTQEELNAIVESRLAKEKAKLADYEELKAKASKLDEMEEANKSELQKATEKAESLQKQLDELTKANELRTIRDKVATETGVPANLLTASTEDECKAQAEAIKAFAGTSSTYPSVKDGGEVQGAPKKSVENQFADWFNQSLK